MTASSKSQSTSTELTGGAGFNYEDLVVAYYLAALLLEGHAAGCTGVVESVAIQQAADHPMDDLVVEIRDESRKAEPRAAGEAFPSTHGRAQQLRLSKHNGRRGRDTTLASIPGRPRCLRLCD